MSDKTAPWIWPSLFEERNTGEVTQAQIDWIRKAVVYWDIAEKGAACLAGEDQEPFCDMEDDNLQTAVEIFLNAAKCEPLQGIIRNPYTKIPRNEVGFLLEDVSDQSIAKLFLSGDDIDYIAEEDELNLWRETSLTGYGIDPKRPFGSENVSRDVRAIVDPDKKLSNRAFAKRRKYLESRLMLTLQFFVQNAQLEAGTYKYKSDEGWVRITGEEPAHCEMISEREWVDRLYLTQHYECETYTKTAQALALLVWENRVAGSYSKLAEQFKLANLHDTIIERRYKGSLIDILQAAVKHFPEETSDPKESWFSMVLVRVLNSQARFAEAKAILQKSHLYNIDPKLANYSKITETNLAILENIITRRGLEELSKDEFQAILSNTHSEWEPETNDDIWYFISNIKHTPEQIEGAESHDAFSRVTATCTQLEIMNGGYEENAKLKRF